MIIRHIAVLGTVCAALLTSSLGSAQASRVNHDRDSEQRSARTAAASSYAPSVDAKNFDLKGDAVRLTPIIDFGSPPRMRLAGTGRV
jgi:hypothetical protein